MHSRNLFEAPEALRQLVTRRHYLKYNAGWLGLGFSQHTHTRWDKPQEQGLQL